MQKTPQRSRLTPTPRMTWVVLLAFGLTLTSAWANPTPPSQRHRVGIVQMGSLAEGEERAFRRLEKRIQRWLENLPALRIGAETVGAGDPGIGVPNGISDLVKLTQSFLRNPNAEALTELRQARQQFSGEHRYGPVLQQSLLAEAVFDWRLGRFTDAREKIREALSLHPEGAFPSFANWELETESFSALPFEKELERERKKIKPICQIELAGDPVSGSLHINGFEVAVKKVFSLPAGDYLFSAAFPGPRSEMREGHYRCFRQGRERLTLKQIALATHETSEDRGLMQVSRKNSLESLCVIKPDRGRFKLFLFTPGVAMEEIPTSEPIRTASLLGESGDSPLPISTDAFVELFQKQRARSLVAAGPNLDPASWMVEKGGPETKKTGWYNDWRFWAIVGGAMSAVAVTYFATRQDGIHSQPSSGSVSVKME